MKKAICAAVMAVAALSANAGGYLTNTNQSVSFLRNPARLATLELDGAYSNPAGLAWIGEGWHVAFNWQNAAQERNVCSTFAPFAYNKNQLGDTKRHFHGEASAPFIPSLDAAYQKGKWTITAHFGVTGGGGKATFNSGLPMFEAPVAMIVPTLLNAGIAAESYSADMYMSGRQYIYGIQAGLTYKFFENMGDSKQGLSAHIGARMNFASNQYNGYLKNVMVQANGMEYSPTDALNTMTSQLANVAAQYANLAQNATDPALQAEYAAQAAEYKAKATSCGTLAHLSNGIELDCTQKGWGIAPIIGIDYRVGNLNIGARYEFKTAMNIENKTKVNTTGVEAFADGVNTPNDIPAILSIGAQYSITKKWRIMAGWDCYFDKDAGMSGDKQKTLDRNTHEIVAGMEYDILPRLTVSGGYQKTMYGQSDAFQSDLSFSCDSYALGFGVKVKINDHFSVDASYFWNKYDDYTKYHSNYNSTGLEGTDVYSRKNRVFGLGVTMNF